MSGSFAAFLFGSGIDLDEVREYVPGDEKRSVNRKISAKYDQLFVNQFHQEKAIEVHILCDFNYNRKGKNSDGFMRFLASLTQYFSSEKGYITAYIGTEQFSSLEKHSSQKLFLNELQRKLDSTLPFYKTSLSTMLQKELSISKKRLIIIISDFLSYNDEEKQMIIMLGQKHEIRCIQMPVSPEIISPGMFSIDLFSH